MIPFLKDFFHLTIDTCGLITSAELPEKVKNRVNMVGVYDLLPASESRKCVMVLTKSIYMGHQFFDFNYMGTPVICMVAYEKKKNCFKIYGSKDDFHRRSSIKKTLQAIL